MKTEIEQIVLNLSYNYPVKWGTWKVFVDFIQNFYDAAGYENFHKQFVYSYENNVLTMSLDNHPFELDWLLYMGASTKRNGSRYGMTKKPLQPKMTIQNLNFSDLLSSLILRDRDFM